MQHGKIIIKHPNPKSGGTTESSVDLFDILNDINILKSKLGFSTASPETITELGSDLVLSSGQVKEIKGKLKFNGNKIKFNGGKIKFVNN